MVEVVRTSIVYPFPLWKTIRAIATEQHRPFNSVVIELLTEILEEQKADERN